MLFNDAEKIRKVLGKFRMNMLKWSHPYLVDGFENGRYRNWEAKEAAIRRAYGKDEKQKYMIDLFRDIDEVMDNNKTTVEIKVQHMRDVLKKIMITDVSKAYKTRDFDKDRCIQRYPEEYSPVINSLITYLLFKKVHKSKWAEIQAKFYGQIAGKPDYDE